MSRGAALPESLQEIGESFGCDKFTVHRFGDTYDRYLSPMRDKPVKLLEIGIGGEGREEGGASLRTWERYFSVARIVGIDIFDKSHLDNERISTFVCDQGDQDGLRQLIIDHGPFDIIIDDGSHRMSDVLHALFVLFDAVRPGGYYIIEDIQTSYWPHYGGTSVAFDFRETTMTWVKLMVDVINAGEILWPGHPAVRSGFKADELHVHHNIAFVRRAEATAPSAILDEPRRAEWLASDFAKTGLTELQAGILSRDAELKSRLLDIVALLK